MATVGRWFLGLETGGEEEFQLASGNTVTSPAPWSSKETYTEKLTWKQQLIPSESFDTTGAWDTIGFNINFSDPNQSIDNDFFEIHQEGSSSTLRHMRLRIQASTDGDLTLVNADNVELATVEDVFSDDTWYRVTVKIGIGTSACKIWVAPSGTFANGDPIIDVASSDFYHDSATNFIINARWRNQWSEGLPAAIYVSSGYCHTDTSKRDVPIMLR